MNTGFFRSAWLAVALASVLAARAADLLPPGHRPRSPGVHALVGATIHVNPSNHWNNATVVIRDGLIEAVGRDVKPPSDARIWNASNTVIYAGFIDPYLSITGTNAPVATPVRPTTCPRCRKNYSP